MMIHQQPPPKPPLLPQHMICHLTNILPATRAGCGSGLVSVSELYYVGGRKLVPRLKPKGVSLMAEEHRAASSGQSQPRREQAGAQRGQPQSGPRRRPPRRRSTAARVAGAFLYVLLVIGASGVLATVGWVWACDLLGQIGRAHV